MWVTDGRVVSAGTEGSPLRVCGVGALKSASGRMWAAVAQRRVRNCLKGTPHSLLLEFWKKFSEVRFHYLEAGREPKKSNGAQWPPDLF